MSALPTPRTSLCLFCSFASASARTRPRHHLPVSLSRIQVAYRSTTKQKRSKPRVQNVRHLALDDVRKPGTSKPLNSYGFRRELNVNIVRELLRSLHKELHEPSFLETLHLTPEEFQRQWEEFELLVEQRALSDGELYNMLNQMRGPSKKTNKPLKDRLRYWFYAHTYKDSFSEAELQNQKAMADLRYPTEWYPRTRELTRTVHLHVGPTNSGKTYHALQRLEQAGKGIYLGPLRLLAHEIYTRFNAKGKPCALVTGEETRVPDAPHSMWSCTVEMAPLNSPFDVAVIDEIQMISHKERGWAWTQAFLGIQAKEVHLCGEARTVPIVKELCALVGDEVHVHEYQRLTPLEVAPQPLGSIDKVEKGDCVVVFSVLGIHAMRREIERKTGRKCAMVYGSLPPETRAQQARLFNDPDNEYDYLVASDAVGMGLNLAIKRVVFESTVKSDGKSLKPLEISDLKQIAGRAGRYKTAHEANTAATAQQSTTSKEGDHAKSVPQKEQPRTVGVATALEKMDHQYLKAGMKKEPQPIKTAGLSPPSIIVERFANYFTPGTPFSYILLRLQEISERHPRFHFCALKDQLSIADTIHTVKGLSIASRYTISSVPANMREPKEKEFLRAIVQRMAEGKSVNLLDFKQLPLNVLNEPMSPSREYLKSLETLHKCLVTYLWLSYRFPGSFVSRKLANYTKKLTEDLIEKTLMEFTWIRHDSKQRKKMRADAMKKYAEGKEGGDQDPDATAGFDVVANTLRVPPTVTDAVMDTTPFAESAPGTDDEGTFTPEDVEILDAEANKTSASATSTGA